MRRAALAGMLTVALAGIASAPASAADLYVPAPPEPGTEIPSAQVNFGMRPYADNTFYVIAMKQGWFEDVGIEIGPEELGLKVTDTNVIALLLNGQLDMASQYCPLLLPTYKTSDTLKCVGFTDNFLGTAILANPALGLKSFKDYIAEGMSFDEAIRAAVAPLEGKTLVGSPVLSKRPFEEVVQQFSGVTWNLETMDDAKALVLAKAGRIDFADPEGAPIVYTLLQDGWTDVVDIGDLYEHGPGGIDSPVEKLVAIVGVAARSDFVNANQNTVLRFLSVIWRTIDAVQKDPSLYELQAPYLNSVAGTDLDAKGVEQTVAILHPYSSFEDNQKYFVEEDHILYWKNAWPAIIGDWADKGLVPADAVTTEEFVWAAPIWQQMKGYQAQSEALIGQLEGQSLDPEKQELLAQAKQHFEWFNFLDAYRLATAAAS
jgi:ABC-type nitrate/sulfonate/bicarbonate transport system substrate-binding protein